MLDETLRLSVLKSINEKLKICQYISFRFLLKIDIIACVIVYVRFQNSSIPGGASV